MEQTRLWEVLACHGKIELGGPLLSLNSQDNSGHVAQHLGLGL